MYREPVRLAQRLLVATVIVTLAFSGPLVPGLSFTGGDTPTIVGDGNATVSEITVETGDFRFSEGRFGTGVVYLRAPPASVDVTSVTGQPRIVYRLRVPALHVDRVGTRMLSGPGDVTVRMDDRAFPPGALSQPRYHAVVTVHVQSRTVYRTVFNASIELEVDR